MRGDKGLTLMELLVVISILGLLVTVMLPFQGRMSDNAKREETIQLLESIRFGLLGAENAYDANGNRVLGGYVGDYGTLPDFVVHEWDTASNYLVIPEDSSTPDAPTILDWADVNKQNYHDASIMPLGLWTNTIRVDDGSSTGIIHNFMPHADWNGPYVVVPRDDFSGDDDLYPYTAPSGSPSVHNDESRNFLLRQGEGRFTDGWGSAIHIYFDGNKNLYFVSAGSDRRITFGDESSVAKPNFGPADSSLPHNEDNLVLMISHEQWNLEDQKIATTKMQLKDLRTAILGYRGSVTDGVQQPNGFIADMGSMELLTGSYVHDGTNAYKCIESHISTGASFSVDSSWVAITGGATGKTLADYPSVTAWATNRHYIGAQPQLLFSNAAYVRDGGTYYRYIHETPSGQSTGTTTHWLEDTTFDGHVWGVQEYSGLRTYSRSSKDVWKYYSNVGFGVGWRGPYISGREAPLTDAFGGEIRFDLDTNGNVILQSAGPDKDYTTITDNIVETIYRSDFEISVTVLVKPRTATPPVAMNENDCVSMYTAFNGELAYFNVQQTSLSGTDGEFLFTKDGEATVIPTPISDGTVVKNAIPLTTLSPIVPAEWYDKAGGGGVRLPIGSALAVFRENTTYTSPDGYQETFILHPRTAPTLTLGD